MTIRVGKHEYPDDIFAQTRMSFGDHIEELRFYLIRAGIGLFICLIIGFVIDGIGYTVGIDWIGVGRPAMDVITDTVEKQVEEFDRRRVEALEIRIAEETSPDAPTNQYQVFAAEMETAAFAPFLRDDVNLPETLETKIRLKTSEIVAAEKRGELDLGYSKRLTTLSVQEPLIVYFKVSLLCGVVISSPWLFMQIWGFVGAGLYPHERRYIHIYLPFSIGLFLSGVLLCQFVVLPLAVDALLAFNTWLNLEPDLRLSEWLGFAILLPLVFGISFQTPLFMLFFERIGMFTVETYKKNWRWSIFIMACMAALITPPDPVSMVALCSPMFALYMLGIWLCKVVPRDEDDFDTSDADEVGV